MDSQPRRRTIIGTAIQNVFQLVSQGVQSLIPNPEMDTLPKDLDKGLYQELECPVCMECMKPPIVMCENGHSICPNCRPKLNNCPSCTKPFLQVRNLALESLSRQATEHNVEMKPSKAPMIVKCPFAAISHEDCPWNGPINGIKSHVKQVHNVANDVHEATGAFNVILTGLAPMQNYKKAVFTNDEMFYIYWQIRNGNFNCIVMYVGEPQNTSKYKYKLTITSESSEKKISIAFPPRYFLDNVEEILQSGDCVILNYNTVLKFLNPNGHLECEFLIQDIDEDEVIEGSIAEHSIQYDQSSQASAAEYYDRSRRHDRRARRHERKHKHDGILPVIKPGRCIHGKRFKHCKPCKYASYAQSMNAAAAAGGLGGAGFSGQQNVGQAVGFYCAPSLKVPGSAPVEVGFKIQPNAPPMSDYPDDDIAALKRAHSSAKEETKTEESWKCSICNQMVPKFPKPQPEPGWHVSSGSDVTKRKCPMCGQFTEV